MRQRSRKRVIIINRTISYILMIILAIFFLFPLLYMISVSLNPSEIDIVNQMSSIKGFIPTTISIENFKDVFDRMPFQRFLFNSVLIVGTTIIAGLIVNSMMAYGLARFSFKGRKMLVSIIVALIIIPFEAIAIPLLLITNKMGWLDSYQVQIIPFIANPLYIFLLYQFFINFPKDLEEAALIDGAGWFKIYWKIVLPLSRPVLASVAILHFLMQWGSFLWPLMVTRGYTYRPLTVAMQTFFGQAPIYWGDIMAFATMMTIPVIILFIFLQNQFVKSVATTGIK